MPKKSLFIGGFALVICGMSLTLRNWEAVTIVFNGIVPVVLAVAGLVLMFAATIKK